MQGGTRGFRRSNVNILITLLTMVGRNINTIRSDIKYPNFFRSGCLFLTKMIEG